MKREPAPVLRIGRDGYRIVPDADAPIVAFPDGDRDGGEIELVRGRLVRTPTPGHKGPDRKRRAA